MAGNPLIQAANNWFNNTIRNGGQKEAPGSASNNTIAAAATTEQTTTPAAPATPAQQSPQTPKKKDTSGNWRNSPAGVSISLGTATPNQKSEAISQGASPQNVGVYETNLSKGLNSKAGIYDVGINIESSQTVTQTRPLNFITAEQAQKFYDASGGMKLTGTPDARQIIETQTDRAIKQDPIIGNTYTTAQTLFTDPVGRPNLQNNLFEQFEAYDKYDGSGSQRKTAAILTAVEIPSYVVGGGVAGVGTRAVQTGLTKLSATKLGGVAVKAATSPISKNVPISPATVAANSVSGVYLGDTAYRILSQPTAEGKISTAGNIALKEIPAGVFGAVKGYTATAQLVNRLRTVGKTEIPAEKVKVPGIPLGNFNSEQLAKSFEKNILSPRPFKFARATNDVGKDTASTVSAKLNKLDDRFELYHVTPTGQYFGRKFTVRGSDSEFDILYSAPKAIEHFFYGSTNDVKVTPSFFIRDFQPAESPAILNLKSRGVKPIDWKKAADSVGRSVNEVKANPTLRKTAFDNFVISEETRNPGFAYMPMIKKEYEAGIPKGTTFKRSAKRYYTKVQNTRVPIYEFEPIGYTAPKTNPRPTGSRFRTPSSGKSGNSKNYVPAASPVSFYSGARSPAKAYNYNSAGIPASLYTGSQESSKTSAVTYDTPVSVVKTADFGVSPSVGKLYNSITQQKATPQKFSISPSEYLSRSSNQLIKRQKKTADERKKTEKLYSAVRTGRIDHLSIKDPLEFYGTGKSITNRIRPDRVLNKQALYFVDNAITTRRPTGRRKVKP